MEIGAIPSIKEELERKAFEELENLIHRRDSGKITNIEYKMGINTLFSICSGLVDRDFFKIISEASKEIENDYSFLRTRVFINPALKEMRVILRKKAGERYVVSFIKCAISSGGIRRVTGIFDELDTEVSTELDIKETVEQYESFGFSEVI